MKIYVDLVPAFLGIFSRKTYGTSESYVTPPTLVVGVTVYT